MYQGRVDHFFSELAHMPGAVCIKKTRRLIHVNFFLQCTMEKSILFIELADGPTIGESKCKYNPMVVDFTKRWSTIS